MRHPYSYLTIRNTRTFQVQGCLHSLRSWTVGNKPESTRNQMGYLTPCTGIAGHTDDHRTADGRTWQ